MLNKDFKNEWKVYDGEVDVLTTKHFCLSIDKDYLGVDFDFSARYRLVYIKILCVVFRLY